MKRWIAVTMLLVFLVSLIFIYSCDYFFDTAVPNTKGMLKGKVVEWDDHKFYAVDLGTIYQPEENTVIFIAAVGSSYEDREDWVVEASCNPKSFTRGIGSTAFTKWPDNIIEKSLKLVCNEPELPEVLEHPLGGLSKEERTAFIYSPEFHNYNDAQAGLDLLTAVKYWAKANREKNII